MKELTKELIHAHKLLISLQQHTTAVKLLAVLKHFEGRPYNSEDNLTTYSFQHFDCLTFVEVVMALLLMKEEQLTSFEIFAQDFQRMLMKLRYEDNSLAFEKRNHFSSLDWIQNNNEYLEEVTNKLGQSMQTLTVIDKSAWFLKVHNLDIPGSPVTVNLSYLPLQQLLDNYDSFINKMPEFALVHIVRVNWPIKDVIGTDLDISHVGFLVKELERVKLWHASTSSKQVKAEDLHDYIVKQQEVSSVAGLNIQKLHL